MWEETLATIAGYLREAFHRSFPFKDDGDVSPEILALRDAFYAFPVPTDVLLVDCGAIQAVQPRIFLDTAREEGPIWTLIAHHVGNASGKRIAFHGTRCLEDVASYWPLLVERFGFEGEYYRDSLLNLTFTGYWTSDGSEIVDFIPFDVRERPLVYGKAWSTKSVANRPGTSLAIA
jgi:hypothetical protein